MVRLLYNLLLLVALPWVYARLFWKSRREPGYRKRIGERFGAAPDLPSAGCVWFHTVSAGETNAAAPMIRALREHFPTRPFLVTTMTPAGSARVAALLGDIVRHCYAPYDYPWARTSVPCAGAAECIGATRNGTLAERHTADRVERCGRFPC